MMTDPVRWRVALFGIMASLILTVTVSDPGGTLGSPHRIDLTLRVIDTPLHEVYAPLVNR